MKIWIVNGQFKELSTEQIKGLEEDSLIEYTEAKAEHYNKKNEEDRANLEKMIQEKASKEDIEAFKAELLAQQNKQLESLNEVLKQQGLAIQKIAKGTATANTGSFVGDVKEELGKIQSDLNEARSSRKNGFHTIEVKAAGVMAFGTNVSGGNIPVEDREAGLNRIRRRRPWVLEEITVGDTMSNVISWVEQANPDGGAGGTAEGTLKNKADFDLVVASINIKKRSVFIKVTDEMLNDIDYLASEIDTELTELLMLDIDNQLLSGDNTGLNLNGIIPNSTTFAAGSFANTIDEANNWDVLQVAINQIDIANHSATVIFMHPSDVTSMKLTKGTDGHYVLPPFTAADGQQVDGLPVRANTGITVDNFLVMDATKSKTFFKERMSIQVGWENDDFTKNLVTILAEARLQNRIKGNDTTAFVTGVFTTAKAALETA